MQVYKKILVTIDCSPVDDAILRHISAVARQNEAKVYLLHVVHSHTLDQDRVMRSRPDPVWTPTSRHCRPRELRPTS